MVLIVVVELKIKRVTAQSQLVKKWHSLHTGAVMRLFDTGAM